MRILLCLTFIASPLQFYAPRTSISNMDPNPTAPALPPHPQPLFGSAMVWNGQGTTPLDRPMVYKQYGQQTKPYNNGSSTQYAKPVAPAYPEMGQRVENPVARRIPICYSCGKEGHINRFCPDRQVTSRQA